MNAARIIKLNAGAPLPFRDLPVGAEVVQYETTITGTAPRYEGWEFLAALDSLTTADGEAEWVVRCAPGVTDESVDRGLLRAGACDHCNTCRPNRRKLYLVRNVDTGKYQQVGATCIKDFLGWDAAPVFISPRDLDDELSGGGSRTPAFTPRFVVVVALATVAAFGWVPRSRAQYDPRAVSTSSTMTPYLVGPAAGAAGEEDRAVIARIEPHVADAAARADEVIATVLAEFVDAASGYEANLRAALRAEYIELGQLGILASIVPAYERIVGRQAERLAQRDAFEPEYLGEVGDKVEVSGVVTTAMTVDGYIYGTTQRLIVIRTDTALVKFCSSAAWTYDVDVDAGDHVTITATIKRLDVWRDQKQTVVVPAQAGRPDASGTGGRVMKAQCSRAEYSAAGPVWHTTAGSARARAAAFVGCDRTGSRSSFSGPPPCRRLLEGCCRDSLIGDHPERSVVLDLGRSPSHQASMAERTAGSPASGGVGVDYPSLAQRRGRTLAGS